MSGNLPGIFSERMDLLMSFTKTDVDAINAIRFLSVDMIEKANSGHPGLPIDAAPMAYVLWEKFLRFNPEDPKWINRDRFVLSAGHGSAMLYSLLHLNKFDLPMDQIKQFRQFGSKTPGHPEVTETAGIDATTGPLGQGLGMAVGMAMAERHLAAKVNRPGYNVFDHYTYSIVGDGDLMEGISQESINIAGTKKLGKLIVLYDSNDISLDGPLSLSSTEKPEYRFKAAGWDYAKVLDGNDTDAIEAAIAHAQTTDQPSIIEIKTTIGYGTPQAGTNKVHGAALGEDNVKAMRDFYNWQAAPFEISDEIYGQYAKYIDEKQAKYAEWNQMFDQYKQEFGDVYNQFADGNLKTDSLSIDGEEFKKPLATRASNSAIMQQVAKANPQLWGGSADLYSSNKTNLTDSGAFDDLDYDNRNVYFGVREFGMAAAVNGINLHGNSRAFGSTFFVFSDYLKAAIRLAAIQATPSIFVFTHDSLAVGEDGPTHEPIEQLAGLRSIPNVDVIRPADATEVMGAWQAVGDVEDHPSVMVMTRQKLPLLPQADASKVAKGAYVISPAKSGTPDGILIATGSEVALALDAQKALLEKSYDVSVVSMPSMNRFAKQDQSYKDEILPKDVKVKISVEMGSSFGWGEYTGSYGGHVAVDDFGASGNGDVVTEHYGFTVDKIVETFEGKWQEIDK